MTVRERSPGGRVAQIPRLPFSIMPAAAFAGGRLPAVAARSVSKTFTVPEERVHTLKERALHPRRRRGRQTFRALNDISFAVAPGEFFGIAGRNGSGKSTLLKCIAGIYHAEGEIWTRGRISTFIELGVGFNMDMAARDNVVMNGIMLGLTPREARRRYDSVIDFAELREFEDLKLKNYSSGMHVRLAFSVAIQVDAEILLIDEVLAVGDAAFQQKCADVFTEMRDAGKTIIFVTHDMGALRRFCHRALLLEHGSPVYIGEPREVGDRYLELNFGREPDGGTDSDRLGDGDARVLRVWVEDETGATLGSVPQGKPVTLRARVQFRVDVEDPAATLYILNDEHVAVLVASTEAFQQRTGTFAAGEEATFSFGFDNVLAPGRYSPVIQLAHLGSTLDVMDRFEGSFSFVVTSSTALGGIVDVPVRLRVDRDGAAAGREVAG
jgi:ABC-type polysaccharide/polyol phosphate transport system ATPase subunit